MIWEGTVCKSDFVLKILLESLGLQHITVMYTDGQITLENMKVLRKCFLEVWCEFYMLCRTTTANTIHVNSILSSGSYIYSVHSWIAIIYLLGLQDVGSTRP